MPLKKLTDETVIALENALPDAEFSDDTKQKISRIIEQSLIKTLQQATQAHHKATVTCCGAEADMAHKIREEVERSNIALTANLSAMR